VGGQLEHDFSKGYAELLFPTLMKKPSRGPGNPCPPFTSKRNDFEMLAPKNQNISNIWPKCRNMALDSNIMDKFVSQIKICTIEKTTRFERGKLSTPVI